MNFRENKRFILLLLLALLLVACGGGGDSAETPEAESPTAAPEPTDEPEADAPASMAEADLDAVKAYAVSNANNMKAGSAELHEIAMRYYQIVAEAGFDYEAAYESAPQELPGLIAAAQGAWLKTSEAYELDEGIVAGTPSLVYYDVLIDAGGSAADDGDEALEWNLQLPDGRVLESPGNYFHSLLEPNLFGTNDEYVGGVVNGIAMPEANLLLGAATGLDEATGKMLDSVNAWEPTLDEAFTAMVVMTPTMNEYFEQWKLSAFVTGESTEETAFVGQSRLFDVVNILNGLSVTYDNVSPLVVEADSDLHQQIAAGYADLQSYVGDLYQNELDGNGYNSEEADLFGTEAQDKATAISGQISQAAAQLNITVDEDFEMITPASAVVDQGLAEAPMMEMSDGMMGEADLDAVKAYAVANAENMKAGSEELFGIAMRYYQLVSEAGFDYDAALSASPEELPGLVFAAQAAWLKTSEAYELDEGIVAGTPSLVYYDVLIDAGGSAEDDGDEALQWNLNLPDGRVLESPGNYFHSLLEPNLFGTNPDYVGGMANGIPLPEANLMLGAAAGLDDATGKMLDSVNAWEPTLEDAFTALVVMTPTMNEYFEQWKLSAFVTGDDSEETAFVGQSRLFDVVNILNGLNVTYDNVSPLVIDADSDLHDQISAGYTDLRGFVGELYAEEQDGNTFDAEEADLFGSEAQDKATAISGQVAQAAAQLNIEVDEEFEMIVPASAETDQGMASAPMMGGGGEMSGADLNAVKAYAVGNAENMKAGSEELLSIALRYFQLVSEVDFDYEAAFEAAPQELPGLIGAAQGAWLKTSEAYELDEGIIAGTPSLVYYDVLIDAGGSAADDGDEALEWNLNLPDGRVLESPGNYFHSLLEPTLFGTNPDYVGGVVNGIPMPEANLMLGAAIGLDSATGNMLDSVNAWEPTLEDAFTALVVMTPTMNEYFEQWKLSAFVTGEDSEETAFVGQSRLFDVVNILNGLNVTYDNVSPLVVDADSDLHDQISAGYTDLRGFVGDLYDEELGGNTFGAEEADLFGTEAQDKATAISGQVAQAAAQLSIEVDEEFEMIVPASAEIDQGFTGEMPSGDSGEAEGESMADSSSSYSADITSGSISPLPRTVTNYLGEEVVIEDDSVVVAVDGPLTEIVFALGMGDIVAASDTSSTWPPEVKELPSVGYVRRLSAEPILALAPTLILTTDDAGPPEAVEQLTESGVTIAQFKGATTVEESMRLVMDVAAALGVESRGEALVAKMEADLAEAQELLDQVSSTPRVMMIYARGVDTVSAAGSGTSVDIMFDLAGIENAVTEWEGYQPLTAEGAVTIAPDAYLLFESGLASVGGPEGLMSVPGLAETPAGENMSVHSMDGLKLTGLGPRLGEAVIELIKMIHPELN